MLLFLWQKKEEDFLGGAQPPKIRPNDQLPSTEVIFYVGMTVGMRNVISIVMQCDAINLDFDFEGEGHFLKVPRHATRCGVISPYKPTS